MSRVCVSVAPRGFWAVQRYMEPLSSAGTRSNTSSFPSNSVLPSRRRLPTRVHVNMGSGKTSFCWPEQMRVRSQEEPFGQSRKGSKYGLARAGNARSKRKALGLERMSPKRYVLSEPWTGEPQRGLLQPGLIQTEHAAMDAGAPPTSPCPDTERQADLKSVDQNPHSVPDPGSAGCHHDLGSFGGHCRERKVSSV